MLIKRKIDAEREPPKPRNLYCTVTQLQRISPIMNLEQALLKTLIQLPCCTLYQKVAFVIFRNQVFTTSNGICTFWILLPVIGNDHQNSRQRKLANNTLKTYPSLRNIRCQRNRNAVGQAA